MIKTRLKRMPDIATVRGTNGCSGTLISEGMLKCKCMACGVVFLMQSDLVSCCPSCAHRDIEKVWTRPQTVMVPENECPTFFAMPFKRGK